MCFYINNSVKQKIADKDIVCYKVVNDDGRPYYRYSRVKYKTGKLYQARNKSGKIMKSFYKETNLFSSLCKIYSGIHSYKDLITVKAEYSNRYHNSVRKTIKCIIPKGTKYYDNGREYISLAIIPGRKVKLK